LFDGEEEGLPPLEWGVITAEVEEEDALLEEGEEPVVMLLLLLPSV